MSYQVIGTCSICRGPVQVPLIWHGVIPPVPACGSCGATKGEDHGPTIQMVPNRTRTTTGTGTIQDAMHRHTTSGDHWTEK